MQKGVPTCGGFEKPVGSSLRHSKETIDGLTKARKPDDIASVLVLFTVFGWIEDTEKNGLHCYASLFGGDVLVGEGAK